MTRLISALRGAFVHLSGDPPSPWWGIAQGWTSRHQGRMRGVVSGRVSTLALVAGFAIVGPACAESFTVTMNNLSPDLGNILITSASAQVRVAASSGAVTFPSGSAVRIKKNGGTPANLPVNTVTVVCGGTGNCKTTYRILVTAVPAPTGLATSVPFVNVGNVSCPANVNCTTSTEAAPSGSVGIINITSTANNFTMTFTIGATVNITKASAANSAAGWSYNVQAIH